MRIGTHFLSTTKGLIGGSVWRPPAMRTTTATSAPSADKSGVGARGRGKYGSSGVPSLMVIARPNAARLNCAAPLRGRAGMIAGAQLYVGAQREFCQDRAAAASNAR